jgi:hypothetical protein
MTTEQNIVNMRKCPRFEGCSIPKCPLDLWSDKRVQLGEDERCPNWAYAGSFTLKNKRQGRKIPSMEGMVKFVLRHRKTGLKQPLLG